MALAVQVFQQRTTAPAPIVTVWRYYRASPGREQQFVRLFMKNTYAVLQAQKKQGVITGLDVYTSGAEGPPPLAWTLMVSIEYPKRLGAVPEPAEDLLTRLFADRQTYDLEQIAASQLVEAQWEVVPERSR